MKKIKKGEIGYINNRKIITTLRTVILFALALGLYFIGYKVTSTNKNFFTIFAVLGLLPASKSCVNMIMFFRFKSLDAETASAFTKSIPNDSKLIYENVLTTTEKSYYLPAIFYRNHTVVSFCENKSNEALSVIEEHVKKSMKTEKIDVTVKVFRDKAQFIDRVKGMMNMEQDEEDISCMDVVYNTIKAISL